MWVARYDVKLAIMHVQKYAYDRGGVEKHVHLTEMHRIEETQGTRESH